MAHHYNGARAAAWARRNAKAKQPFPDACALFFSLGVWEGGLQRTKLWTDAGYRGTIPGTPTATVVKDLVSHLVRSKLATITTIYEWSPGNEPEGVISNTSLGDGIVYDYGYGTGYGHIAMITGTNHGVPLVSEWGAADWPLGQSRYARRRWYYSYRFGVPMHEYYPQLRVSYLRMK